MAVSGHPKAEPSKKEAATNNLIAAGVPAAPQRAPKPQITLNMSAADNAPDDNDGENSEVIPTEETAAPASGRPVLAEAEHLQAIPLAAEPSDPPKAKSAKRDSAREAAPAEAAPALPQQSNPSPIAVNIFAASATPEKNREEDLEAPPSTDRKAGFTIVADASAEPHTALWQSPRIQANQQSETKTQAAPDQPLAVAANVADGSLSKIGPAFEVRLQPATPQESLEPVATAAAPGKPEISRPPKDMPLPSQSTAAITPETAPGVAPVASTSSRQGDGSRHPTQERPAEPTIAATRPVSIAEIAQPNSDLTAVTQPTPATTSPTSPATRAETPMAEPPPTSVPQTTTITPAAHDIKLELNGGGQRVEVRMTERGGDIHVAVRTPDARLSEAMREDLPALATKLEQSGFRTDVLQPGAAGAERRTLETGAGNPSRDSQEHAGQNQQQKQDNPQEQHPKNLTNAPNRRSDRKDFAWLLQTYR